MRHCVLYILAIIFFPIICLGCSKDFDAKYLEDQLRDHEQRLQNIEAQVASLNTQINSIQATLTAIEKKLTITSVETITTSPGGYKITFSDGKVATIMNGTDGTSGTAPTIGVDSEGYWLINGDRITANGQEIKAVGKDGTDGDKGDDGLTPIMGVDADGYWTVTVGEQTERIKDENGKDVKARGEDGKDGDDGNSFFKDVTIRNSYVIFTLNDSETDPTTFSIPLCQDDELLTIHVEIPGTLSELLTNTQKRNTYNLKVTGEVNDEDITTIRCQMLALEYLDLSEIVNVTYNAKFDQMITLREIILPVSPDYDPTTYRTLSLKGCRRLEKLTITKAFKNIEYCFDDECVSLKTLVYAEGIVSVDYPYGQFVNIEFPSTLSSIKNSYFQQYYTKLKTVTIKAKNPPTVASFSFRPGYGNIESWILKVPKGCIDVYKNASGWKQFGTIIEIDE